MALDKVLIIYDEQGNPVDYDILAKDVKFQPDGKDLPTKLAEMEQEIEDAAGGGYAPPAGGIPKSDLASGVQSSLDKADTALQQSDKTELQNEINNKVDAVNGKGLSTNDFTDALLEKLNSLDPYTKAQVDALIAAASSGAVSVTTNQDGTFTIHVGDTDYTINLNHTHENMAKIVKCTEATLPQTLENDTIYVQVDNLTNPQDIESLWLFGLEFTGGGAAPGVPTLDYPRVTELTLEGDGTADATATIKVKAKNITGSVNVAISGTDFSITEVDGTALQAPITSVNGPLVISNADALAGVMLTIAYSGTTSGDEGGLVITSAASTAEFSAKSVDLVTNITQGIPTGWLENTAWSAATGEEFTEPESVTGFCTTNFIAFSHNASHKINITIKAGYLSGTDLSPRGMFVLKEFSNDAKTNAAYLQSADPRRLEITDNANHYVYNYLSATMKISELRDCYIYDNSAGTYLWAGINVDTSVAPDVQS